MQFHSDSLAAIMEESGSALSSSTDDLSHDPRPLSRSLHAVKSTATSGSDATHSFLGGARLTDFSAHSSLISLESADPLSQKQQQQTPSNMSLQSLPTVSSTSSLPAVHVPNTHNTSPLKATASKWMRFLRGAAAGSQRKVEPTKKSPFRLFKPFHAPNAEENLVTAATPSASLSPLNLSATGERTPTTCSEHEDTPPRTFPVPATTPSASPVKNQNSHLSPAEQERLNEETSRLERRHDFIGMVQGSRPLHKRFIKKYKMGDLLGDGAFGFVVVAQRLADHAEVAVKFIMKDKVPASWYIRDPKLGRVPLEVHILRTLHHPNIIGFLDYFEDEKYLYLVTELHGTQWDLSNPLLNTRDHQGLRTVAKLRNDGNNLLTFIPSPDAQAAAAQRNNALSSASTIPEQVMQRRRTSCDLFECIDVHHQLPEATGRYIFSQIVSAVHYMHTHGFVHRDLKDENIVIDAQYRVKLIDFGAAAYIPRVRSQYFDKFSGTPQFASPEILAGGSYRGPEAEVWSLGVLLFTIVFGQNPFDDTQQIMRGDLQFPWTPVNERRSGVLDLIRRMLTVEVQRRMTIEEVARHPWLQGPLPSLPRRATPPTMTATVESVSPRPRLASAGPINGAPLDAHLPSTNLKPLSPRSALRQAPGSKIPLPSAQ